MQMLIDLPQVRKKSFNLTTEEQKSILWKTIDLKRARWIEAIRLEVVKIFKEESRRAIKAIEEAVTPASAIEGVEAEIDDNRGQWKEFFDRTYLSVGSVFALDVVRSLKGRIAPERKADFEADPFNIIDPLILDHIRSVSGAKIVGIGKETKRRVRAALEAGIEEGEGFREIAKRIDKLYLDKIIPNRSMVIARTEVIQASNQGALAGAKATGIPDLKKVWLTTRDILTRTNHEAIDGESIGIDAVFILGDGSRLNFPADSSLGAAAGEVINCRCSHFFEGDDDGDN